LSTILTAPAANGSNALALRGLTVDLAEYEGLGKGEFQAWFNNLRNLIGAVATILIGNYYAWCRKNFPRRVAGSTFFLTALFGNMVPLLYLRTIEESALQKVERLNCGAPSAQRLSVKSIVGT